jgi:hypothetical protein
VEASGAAAGRVMAAARRVVVLCTMYGDAEEGKRKDKK